MTDTVSVATRSRIMASIKGKDTVPEMALRKALSVRGYRYRVNYRIGRRTIDIAFPRKKVAVYIDGCFWHGCPKCYKKPKSNTAYWSKKIEANKSRDIESNKNLRKLGWRVTRVWEHEIKDNQNSAVRKVFVVLKA